MKNVKKLELSKVDKVYVTRCSNSHFFFFSVSISFKTILGETKWINEKMTTPWLETTLPTILSWYTLQDVVNADEFGLFYQCVPNKTYHFKDEMRTGGKHSKVRLTVMAAGNKCQIVKSNTPRCFKAVKNVPCCYRAQPKSCISSELLEE